MIKNVQSLKDKANNFAEWYCTNEIRENIVNNIEKDKTLIKLWKDYQAKHQYAQRINYNRIIETIRFISNEIN